MSERRIFARHTPTALTYVSAGAANGGILLNVSEAGCALQLISPPPAMSDVNLELDLGSSLPHLEVAGKVIWADDTGCTGVRFNYLSEAARQTIRRFLEITPADPTMHEIGMGLDPLVAREPEEALFDSLNPQTFESRLQELSSGAAFVAIAEECRNATGGMASALAMLKGRDMVCRASCGKGAPPSGARLDITSERSFTAQCVSTATTLRCVDSQIDPRVNAQVCQRLGIRSVTAMPLMHHGLVVGVLEVFSSERNAFHDGHIATLEKLGRIAVEFAVSRHEITLSSSQTPPPPAATSQAVPPRPAERPPASPVSPGQPANRPVSQFGTSFTSTTAVAVQPAAAKESITVSIQQKPAVDDNSHRGAPSVNTERKPERPDSPTGARPVAATAASSSPAAPPPTPSTSKSAAAGVIEGLAAKSSSAAAPAPALVAQPTPVKPTAPQKPQPKAQKLELAPVAEEPAAFVGLEYSAANAEKSRPLFQAHTQPARGNSKGAIIAAVAVAVLLIAALGMWQFLRDPSTSPSAQTVAAAAPLSTAQPDNPASATSPALSPVSAPDTTSSSTLKNVVSPSKDAKPKQSSNTDSDDSAEKSDKKVEKRVTREKESLPEPKVIALAQSGRLGSQQTPAVAPPTITTSSSLPTLLAGTTTTSLPSLRVAPSAAPSGPLKVSSTAITDHLIRKVDPVYPEMARRSGVSGAVRLKLEIGVDGKVHSATVLDGPPVLAASAKDAVLQWRYRPYVVDNKPVPFETEIVVRFTGR